MRATIACLLLLLPARAFAWDGSARQVAGVTNTPALVATAHDGAHGAFIAWQEPASAPENANTLHLVRLTPEGDAHPSWPAGGVALGGGAAVRTALRLLSDDAGGVYAWWMQGGTLRLTRVLGGGAVATGWTAGGRLLGSLSGPEHRPWVEADGAGGVWLGWFQGARAAPVTPSVVVAHFGPNGQAAGGWPSASRAIPLSPADDEWVYSASFAVAADGGAWALVATGHVTESGVTPGEWRLARLTASGQIDPPLTPEGVVIAPFEADQVGLWVPVIGMGAITPDDAGGVLVVRGAPTSDGYGSWSVTTRMERRLADGSLHPVQPPAAFPGQWFETPGDACTYVTCAWADFSPVLQRDAAGDLLLGTGEYQVHAGLGLRLQRLDPAGASLGTVGFIGGSGIAMHRAFGQGWVISTFDPTGPTHPFYDPAYASVGYFELGKGASYHEETFSPYSPVYVGSDVASLPDGGALLVWARAQAPTGLYALRVGATGSPLAVEPGAGPAARGLRLVREGATLRAEWDAGAGGVLTLHDVAGRERARLSVSAGAGAAAIAPRDPLTPGVYFARLARTDGTFERARAIVMR